MARGSYYKGDNRGRMLSGFWANCPANKLAVGMEDGTFMFDDFHGEVAAVTTDESNWLVDDSDCAVGILNDATQTGAYGAWKITGDATDNDEAWIQRPGSHCLINANTGKVWFEVRVKKSSVVDTVLSMFTGLALVQAVGNDKFHVDDDGTVADTSFVGFNVQEDNAEEIDTLYNTASGGVTTLKANAGTMVADTWQKFGIYFDGIAKITYYLDGVALADTVLESASNFPDGVLLSPAFAVKTSATSTASNAWIDWCAVGFQING